MLNSQVGFNGDQLLELIVMQPQVTIQLYKLIVINEHRHDRSKQEHFVFISIQ